MKKNRKNKLSLERPKAKAVSTVLIALLVFFVSLSGYVAYRYYISNDIFGGDVINAVGFRESSLLLNKKSFKSLKSFSDDLWAGKEGIRDKDKNAYLYNLLSREGKGALKQLAGGSTEERDTQQFILELNKAFIDKNINWPDIFTSKPLKGTLVPKTDTQNYNLLILYNAYPDYINPNILKKNSILDIVKNLPKSIDYYFTIKEPTRYSPLTGLYSQGMYMYLQASPERVLNAIIITGLQYALLMALVFLLSLKIIRSVRWSILAVFLFAASVSTILCSYQLFSLPYLLVPLAMAGAFYAYLQYKDTGKIYWLIFFIFWSVIGPWFREFPGAIPFIVFASEILRFKGRRSLVILLVCIPLMVHAVYPALFAKLIGLNKGGVYSVFQQGNVKQITNKLSLNYYFSGLLFVQFAPTLWALVVISIGFWLWKSRIFFKKKKNTVLGIVEGSLKAGILLFLVIKFSHAFFKANKALEHTANTKHGIYLLLLIAFVGFASFRFDVLPPVFFLIGFLPFLKVGLAELHLSFVLIPLAIIFSLWIKELFSLVRNDFSSGKRKIVLGAIIALFSIGLTDQFFNILSCAYTQKKLVDANRGMGTWISSNLPKHSIVICNFYNFADVFYYSNYSFDAYESVENCPRGPEAVIHDDGALIDLYNKNSGIKDIYFLAADHPFFSWQKDYHSHRFVKNPPGEIERLADFKAESIYYYADPIKYFVPRFFVSFIGYMDWSTDFYFNNRPVLFSRVLFSDYSLYKLKDINLLKAKYKDGKVAYTGAKNPPLLVGSLHGYNIVSYDNLYYGVPQSWGPMDLALEESRSRPGIVVGKSYNEAKALIDSVITDNSKAEALPILVGDYKKYNIVQYDNLFYGVPQSLGPMDLALEENRKRPGIVVGKNFNEIKKLIALAIKDLSIPKPQPVLVGEYRRYNIVNYNNLFYGVPQSLGSLDLAIADNRNRPEIIVGKTYDEVSNIIGPIISDAPKADAHPVLLGEYKKYNIIYYNSLFYGVPQSLGELDLAIEGNRNHPEIIAGETYNQAEQLIDSPVIKDVLKVEAKTKVQSQSQPQSQPILVGEHKKYNIVKYNDLFYGVPQSLGPMDLAIVENRNRSGIVAGKTYDQAKMLIDSVMQGSLKVRTKIQEPILVGEHKKYNIVKYNDLFYGVPQSLGPMDLAIAENRNRSGIVIGKSVKETQSSINKAALKQLLEKINKFINKILKGGV